MIRNIIFDFGGVLIDWDPRYLYRKLMDSEEEIEQFLSEVCHMEWNEEQDGGRSLALGTALKIQEFPQHSEMIAAFYSRWEEMLGGPITDNVNILDKIRRRNQYNLFGLTNWSSETFPIAQSKYEFLSWFDGIVVSGQEKMKKPDFAIYNLLLSRYQIQASESLFIDDNIRNIKAAEAIGIQCIHYISNEQLSTDIKSRSIL